jgi:hypothetical protein
MAEWKMMQGFQLSFHKRSGRKSLKEREGGGSGLAV